HLYTSSDHQDLHSFPTRRSSDLTGLRRRKSSGFVEAYDSLSPTASCYCLFRGFGLCFPLRLVGLRRPVFPLEGSSRSSFRGISRSEEHTSELQSRFELVCRLLLE